MKSNLKDFYASDSLEVIIENSEYKASEGYTCHLLLMNSNPDAKQDWLANADGDNFKILKISTETATVIAGRYKVFYIFSNNAEGFTKAEDGGFLEVRPDITQTATYEFETYNMKALDAVNQRLAGHFDDDFSTYSIDGKTITKMNTDELIKAKEYFERKVKEELNLTTNKKTGKNKNTMRIVFDAPWRF